MAERSEAKLRVEILEFRVLTRSFASLRLWTINACGLGYQLVVRFIFAKIGSSEAKVRVKITQIFIFDAKIRFASPFLAKIKMTKNW